MGFDTAVAHGPEEITVAKGPATGIETESSLNPSRKGKHKRLIFQHQSVAISVFLKDLLIEHPCRISDSLFYGQTTWFRRHPITMAKVASGTAKCKSHSVGFPKFLLYNLRDFQKAVCQLFSQNLRSFNRGS